MDLIDQIGPVLGFVAFFGLTILALLLFQQGRDVRRLREWAGRAPERAQDAADASQAAAEARGELAKDEDGERERGRISGFFRRIWAGIAGAWAAFDRRLPIDGRIVVAILVVAVVAAGVLTAGFGLVGNDEGGGGKGTATAAPPAKKTEVAVLNGTQTETDAAVPGLAAEVSSALIRPLDYKVAVEGDAPSGAANTTVMFAKGQKPAAEKLAAKLRKDLGKLDVVAMSNEVENASKGADVALVIGLDNSTFSP